MNYRFFLFKYCMPIISQKRISKLKIWLFWKYVFLIPSGQLALILYLGINIVPTYFCTFLISPTLSNTAFVLQPYLFPPLQRLLGSSGDGQSREFFRRSPPANYCILPKGPFHLPPCQSCELVKCANSPSRWRARPCFLPFFRTFHFRPPVTFIVITSFVRITPYHYSISNSLHDFNPAFYRIFGRVFWSCPTSQSVFIFTKFYLAEFLK